MIRVVTPYAVFGLVVGDWGVVIDAAPIARYMIGWDAYKLGEYCARKGWCYEPLKGVE